MTVKKTKTGITFDLDIILTCGFYINYINYMNYINSKHLSQREWLHKFKIIFS